MSLYILLCGRHVIDRADGLGEATVGPGSKIDLDPATAERLNGSGLRFWPADRPLSTEAKELLGQKPDMVGRDIPLIC